MDFKLGEKEKLLKAEIAEFAKKEMPADWVGFTLIDRECSNWEFEKGMSRKLAQRGWLVMSWPKEYGGQDASLWEQTVYDMELAYWRIPGATMGISGVGWVGPCLMLFGNKEQKRKYLPMIASGEADGLWCTGYSEPNAGSDLANLQTRATKDGDNYIINGQKVWTSAAHRARWCWLMARTDTGDTKKHRGLSLFIVDMKSPGITVRPLLNYYERHHFNELFFDNVRIPATNLVGEENRGWYQLMKALAFERRSPSPTTYGAFKRLLEELVEHTRNTQHEGRRLSDNPAIRRRLAELAIELEILKLFAFQMTWKMSYGEIPAYEASRNKLLIDRVTKLAANIGVEILGMYAQADPKSNWAHLNGVIQGAYLGFPGNHIAAGTAEIEKSIIAQFRLGLPKSY